MTSAPSPATILDSQTHVLRSDIVGDEYQLAVWLPPSHAQSTQRYPVLYLLDSPAFFGFVTSSIMGQIWEDLLPEMIIVGIGKPIASYDEWWPVRSRDYSPVPLPNADGSGRAAMFRDCLSTELLPYVDKTFRTDVMNRALWGHSLGGAFALYMLLNGSRLFNRYIATSPAVVFEGKNVIGLDTGAPAARSRLEARVFVSVGSLDHEYRSHIERFSDALRERMYEGLEFSSASLPEYKHISAAPVGFLEGIRAVFGDAT